MSKRSKLQKAKRSFRSSKAWKDFRHEMNVKQNGIDPITGKKLRKGCNLHHRHVTASEEEYGDISDSSDYVMLNSSTHRWMHEIFRYWKSDPDILRRIEEEFKLWY